MKETTNVDGSDRKGRERVVSRRDVLRGVTGGLTVTVGLAGLSTPVAAKQGAIYDFFESDGEGGGLTKSWSAAKAGFGRMFADDEKRTAKESARETTDVFNQNSETIVDYANAQLDDGRDKRHFDVIRVKFSRDVTVERWIVADVDVESNTFTSASMVETSPDRDVDEWVRLEGLAAVDAPDELDRFVDEYAEEDKAVDPELEGRLAGRYGPDVESSLLS